MLKLSWIVRGLVGGRVRTEVKDFCMFNEVNIVCFQDIKLANVNSQMLRSLGGYVYTDWSCLPAVGSYSCYIIWVV